MPLHFRIRTLSGAGQSTERLLVLEPLNGEIFIGRYRGSQIELPLPAVSGRHARLWREGEAWQVEDLGSANGTFRNGCRLVPQRSEPLLLGDVLGVLGVEVVFEGEEKAVDSPSQVESTHTLARRLVSDLFGACRPAEVPRLLCQEGNSEVLRLTSLGRCYSVGRGAACDLVLADEDVSRGHAELERRWDGVYLRDLGSKNGTLLDGRPTDQQVKLRDGAVLQVGKTQLRFEDPEEGYLKLLQEAEADAEAAQLVPANSEALATSSVPPASSTASSGPSSGALGESTVDAEAPAERPEKSSPLAATGRRFSPTASHFRPTLAAALAAVVLVAVAAIGISLLLGLWK